MLGSLFLADGTGEYEFRERPEQAPVPTVANSSCVSQLWPLVAAMWSVTFRLAFPPPTPGATWESLGMVLVVMMSDI